jgi:hypothetical protein
MKFTLVLVLGLVLTLSLGGQVFAQTQMTFKGTNYASSTFKATPVDQGRVVLIGEQLGIEANETGKGPFNNLSTHFALIIYFDDKGGHFHGYGTYADKDGDKMIWEIWDFPVGADGGKGKLIGATGKFAGMEGTADFVNEHPKAWPESTNRLICHEVFKVTLKNPL